MHATDWDVEQYRNQHEPVEHWRLCRAFMEAHKGTYPEAQLVCLAQCFANMEFLGCRYPEKTMRLVRQLSENIADGYRLKRKKSVLPTLVSASDAAEAKVARKRVVYEAGGGTQAMKNGFPDPAPTTGNLRVEATNNRPSDPAPRSGTAGVQVTNNRLSDPAPRSGAAGVQVTSNRLSDPAPRSATAGVQVTNSRLSDPAPKTGTSITQATNNRLCDPIPTTGNSGALILVDWVSDRLGYSCVLCNIPVVFDYERVGIEHHCSCIVDGDVISKATATKRVSARKAATVKALAALEKRCYMIRRKRHVLADEVTRAELMAASDDADKVRQDSESVGGRLLAKMGWTGGGLGKEGQGILEPVIPERVVNRRGLGSAGVTRNFRQKVEQRLRMYISEFQECGLVFTDGYSSAERMEIRRKARAFGLQIRRNRGKEHDLVLSYKVNIFRLLSYLIAAGGHTDRYELVPPAGVTSAENTSGTMHATDWDVEQYRTKHESAEHWRLCRAFMEAHKDTYPEPQLVYLARCFTNMEFLGRRYPEETTLLVRELSAGLTGIHWEKEEQSEKRIAGAAGGGTHATEVRHCDTTEATVVKKPIACRRNGVVGVPNATEADVQVGTTDAAEADVEVGTPDAAELDLEFGTPYTAGADVEVDTSDAAEADVEVGTPDSAELDLEFGTPDAAEVDVEVDTSEAAEADVDEKPIACDTNGVVGAPDVVEADAAQRPISIERNGRTQEAKDRLCYPAGPTTPGKSGYFVLIDPHKAASPYGLLIVSSEFCNISVQYYSPTTHLNTCQCIVGGDMVSWVNGGKKKAAAEAVAALQKRCYTILRKRQVTDDTVQRAELMEPGSVKAARLKAMSNTVGGRLLVLMGWSGGGLGKREQGRTEPVRHRGVFGRQGLGAKKKCKDKVQQPIAGEVTGVTEQPVSKEFADRAARYLKEFASEFRTRDISFRRDYSNPERLEIDRLAHSLGLKSKCRGRKETRRLVVSHKLNPQQMVPYLISVGGHSDKYELVPPTDFASAWW